MLQASKSILYYKRAPSGFQTLDHLPDNNTTDRHHRQKQYTPELDHRIRRDVYLTFSKDFLKIFNFFLVL